MTRLHRRVSALIVLLAAVPSGAVPAGAAPRAAVPATPTGLHTTSIGNSSVRLAWTAPPGGPRPDHFRVYDGDAVATRNTTTRALVTGLAMLSTHTFRVTAVTRDGTESAPSEAISVPVYVPGMQPSCRPGPSQVLPIAAAGVTPTAASVSWPAYLDGTAYRVVVAGQDLTVTEPQVRLGGLPAGRTTVVQVTYRDCRGTTIGGTVPVTTPAGPSATPGAPAGVTAGPVTDSSAVVSWSAPATGARSYAVYRGATRLGTTTETSYRITRLWRGDRFTVTVAAIGTDGSESAHGGPLTVAPAACDDVPPRPENLTATPVSASSVDLRWLSRTEAASYTVLDGARVVASVTVPSARVTGLRSASAHRFAVRAELPDSCGATAASRRAPAVTFPGPAARPGAPADLQPVWLNGPDTKLGEIAVTWTAPAGRVASYRVYEGATLLGETAGTTFSTVLLPATVHRVTVVAVDAAGAESVPAGPVTVTGFYRPLP